MLVTEMVASQMTDDRWLTSFWVSDPRQPTGGRRRKGRVPPLPAFQSLPADLMLQICLRKLLFMNEELMRGGRNQDLLHE